MINIVNKGINIFSKSVFLRGGGYNVAMGSQQKLCLRAKSAPPPLLICSRTPLILVLP